MAELDNISILYNTVSKDYDLGSYEDFNTKLSDPEKRKKFYETVGSEYNLGTYDQFENKLKKKEPTVSDGQGSVGTDQNIPQESVSDFKTDANIKEQKISLDNKPLVTGNLIDKPSNIFQQNKFADLEYGLVKESEKRLKYNKTPIADFDYDRNTLTRMASGFANGVANLPKTVVNALDYIDDLIEPVAEEMVKLPFQPINALFPGSKYQERIKRQAVGGKLFDKDPIDKIKDTDWYKEYTDNLKTHAQEIMGDESIAEQWRSGDIKGAVNQALTGASQSLPLTLTALFGGSAGLTAIGLGSAGEKYDELKDSELPQSKILLNSAIHGNLEMLTETVTQGYGSMLGKIYMREGKEAGTKLIAKGLKGWFEKPLKQLGIYGAPIGEGLSEGVNGISQYLSDVAFGVEDYDSQKLKDTFINDFTVGATMGTTFTLAGASGKLMKTRSQVTQENNTIKKGIQVDKPKEEREQYLDSILKDVPTEYKEPARKQITELLVKKDELQYKADHASDKLKPVWEKQVKAIDNAIADVIDIEEGFTQDTEKKGDQLKQVEPKPEVKEPVKVESAVIEINGKQYEGRNHAEAILRAKKDGQDISMVDRQAEGVFKLSDGSIINREQAKKQFGQDRSELLIPQDEAANQANKEYANAKEQKTETGKVLEGETGRVQEPVKEPKTFKATRIEGLGMGQSQAKGTYFSTEKKNRYGEEYKTKKYNVIVENPIEFDQNKNKWPKYQNEILNTNKDKFDELDFESATIPKKITIDDLSKKGLDKLGEYVTTDLKSKGYDSINFTGKGENEIVVFETDDALKSNNPTQIYDTYKQEELNIPSKGLTPVEEFVLSRKINKDSWLRFGDRNKIDDIHWWFTKKDQGSNANDIDTIADEISRMTGKEISTDDVVDIIEKFPSRYAKKQTELSKALRRRYKAITGQSIDTHELQKEAESEELTKEDNDWINEVPEDRIQDLKGSVTEWGLTPENIDEYEWLFNNKEDFNDAKKLLNDEFEPEGDTDISEETSQPVSEESETEKVTKPKKIEENATRPREKTGKVSNEKVRDDDGRESGKADIRDNEKNRLEARTREERLKEANSVEEIDELLTEGLYNQNDKDWVQKKYELSKQKKYYKVEDEINSKIEKESSKKTKSMGFGGVVPLDIFKPQKSKPDKTLFSKYKGLSKTASKEWQHKTGKVNSILYKGNYIAKDAIKAAKEVYNTKKLSDEQSKEILSVLENIGIDPQTRTEQLNKLPVGLRPHIEKMRNFIDELTTDIQKTGILSSGNEVKFDANRGFYLTRTYQKNTNKDWTWETIPDKTKKQAAKVLLEYYPEATSGEIIGKLKGLLEDKTFASYTTPNAPLGKMNLGITKSRSQFLTDNPEIREFLGENKDPFFNFAVSVAKMSELAERAKFLENVTGIGIKEGWLSPKQTEDMYIPIDSRKIMGFGDSVTQSKAGKSFAPLGEYFTTPEIAQAFNTFNDGVRITNKALQWYMKGVSFVKKSKTAYSIGSQSRNLQSNLLNVVGNGNWNVWDTAPEIKNRVSNWREFIYELKENTIIGDNVDTKAILKNIEEISGMMDNMYNENESGLAKSIKKLDRKALDLYTAGDDVFKVYRYVSEYSRYARVYEKQGLSKEDALNKAKNTASDILHDTSTYYSMLPKFMDKLRYMPFTGSFITFPYLTTINVINTAKLAAKEMSNMDTFHIGLQRSIGMISSLSALGLYTMAINLMAGLDDEDIDDIRNALPSYWKNDMIAIKENKGEGKFTYANSSYLDYYNSITTPIWTLERKYAANGDLTDKDIKEALTEFVSPYIQKDILFQKSINLLNNWDAEKKREVYNEGETLPNKIGTWNEYLWEAFEPGTITDIKRTINIYKEGEDWVKFGKGRLTGRQVREIDVVKSFDKYNVPTKKADFDNSIKIYKDALYEKGLSDKEKETAKTRAEERLNSNIDELREVFMSYINIGADPEKLKEGLKYPGLDKDIRDAIISGNKVRLELGENGKTVSVKSIE